MSEQQTRKYAARFISAITWHSQLPMHENEYTVVESEWGERNHLHEQYKKELNPALRLASQLALFCQWEGSRAASTGAHIWARGRAQTRVEFSAFMYTAKENIVIPKQGLKSQMDEVD